MMRIPLKYQIMVPMVCVMLFTVFLSSLVEAYVAAARASRQIERQLTDLADTLTESSFPLTDRVLQQMRGLSGAEFVATHEDGKIVASSTNMPMDSGLLAQRASQGFHGIRADDRLQIADSAYYHVSIDLMRTSLDGEPIFLHCFYPESNYQQAWREAATAPLLLGTVSLMTVIAISSLVSLRVTRPIQQLCKQVGRIARGDFAALAVPQRNDELRDLATAINRMSEMLAQYEAQVRSNERLRTLDQLGGGIAHQLRNSVTGCRMAVDLHRRQCSLSNDESIDVALEQLELMEKYLRRFLALGKREQQPFKPTDFAEVVNGVLPLVRPRSMHLGVALEWQPPAERPAIQGDADALSQVVVNVLLNAVEAAAEKRARHEHSSTPLVSIRMVRSNDRLRLEVFDPGDGPKESIQDQLFEPLVSGKQDGVGLGLAITREIVESHGGTVGWRRAQDMTCFFVELPIVAEEIENAHAAYC